jgi:hypothetical protein
MERCAFSRIADAVTRLNVIDKQSSLQEATPALPQ